MMDEKSDLYSIDILALVPYLNKSEFKTIYALVNEKSCF